MVALGLKRKILILLDIVFDYGFSLKLVLTLKTKF